MTKTFPINRSAKRRGISYPFISMISGFHLHPIADSKESTRSAGADRARKPKNETA